jgi:hypothetical protein
MTSPMNHAPFQPEGNEPLNWKEALDWLFGELEVSECDPAENEWQVGYEAALRDMFFRLNGRDPSSTLH